MGYTRRHALLATGALLGAPITSNALLPLLLRFFFTSGVRAGASAAVRGVATRAVTRTVVSGGVTRSVQMVASREIGLSIGGVAFVSVAMAQAVEDYNCKAVCVIGNDKDATLASSSPVKEAMNLTINIINAVANTIESDRGIYITPGEFQYSIPFPNFLQNGVKRLEAVSPRGLIKPVSSENFYLAHPLELFR